MSSHVYYTTYKKVPKEKIRDAGIPIRIKALLKDSPTSDTKFFLESLLNYYESYSGLTIKQRDALKGIESAVAERMTTEHQRWIKEYDAGKRRTAIICAKYYDANPPYYGALVKNILEDENFVPTKKQFESMTSNRYAKKVLLATFSEPVYEVGHLVVGRVNAPEPIRNKCATVVSSNSGPVQRAAKGSKPYMVLPIGEPKPVQCEERHLKKFREST